MLGNSFLCILNYNIPTIAESFDPTNKACPWLLSHSHVFDRSACSTVSSRTETSFVPELAVAPSIGDGTGQRSRIDGVTLTIGAENVDIQPDAFSLIQRGTDIVIPVTFDSSVNADGNTEVVLGFSGDLTRAAGALIDGFYELTIDATKISSNGYTLDLDGDSSTDDSLIIGDDEADGLFARYGDWTGDGILNVFDLLEFRKTYGKNPGDAGYNETLDFDTSGVGIFDLLEFRKRFGEPAMNF